MQSVLLFLYFLFIDGNSAKSQEKVNGKKDHLFLPTGLLSILKIGSLETFQGRRENIHVPTHQSVSKDSAYIVLNTSQVIKTEMHF